MARNSRIKEPTTDAEVADISSATDSSLVPQAHGGALRFWPKGVSGNPAGRPRNRVATMLFDAVEDDETARALLNEYFRLCREAKSEELRARMLQDLLDRVGLPRAAPRDGASASATVVNLIRTNVPDLNL